MDANFGGTDTFFLAKENVKPGAKTIRSKFNMFVVSVKLLTFNKQTQFIVYKQLGTYFICCSFCYYIKE